MPVPAQVPPDRPVRAAEAAPGVWFVVFLNERMR